MFSRLELRYGSGCVFRLADMYELVVDLSMA
jgi:hypothetical protein